MLGKICKKTVIKRLTPVKTASLVCVARCCARLRFSRSFCLQLRSFIFDISTFNEMVRHPPSADRHHFNTLNQFKSDMMPDLSPSTNQLEVVLTPL